MKKFWILIVIMLITAAPLTAEIKVTDKLDLGKGDENVKAGVQTLCIDGQKFVMTYGWAAKGTVKGAAAGGGVSIAQVYEESDGKVLPAKCR